MLSVSLSYKRGNSESEYTFLAVIRHFGTGTITASGFLCRHLDSAIISKKLLIMYKTNSDRVNSNIDLRQQQIDCYWMNENLCTFWSLGSHIAGHLEKYLCIFDTATCLMSCRGIFRNCQKKTERKRSPSPRNTIFPAGRVILTRWSQCEG